MNCLGFGGLACQPPFRRREVGGEAAKAHRQLTVSLISAVLRPPPWDKLAEVGTAEPVQRADKLSRSRLATIAGVCSTSRCRWSPRPRCGRRLLYYWSRLYSLQLSKGDDYTKLCPTISICFVNGDLFAGRESYRSEFRLLEADGYENSTKAA
jgi:hypothetical protein